MIPIVEISAVRGVSSSAETMASSGWKMSRDRENRRALPQGLPSSGRDAASCIASRGHRFHGRPRVAERRAEKREATSRVLNVFNKNRIK